MQENLFALNMELEERVKRRTQALAESETKARFLLNAMPQQVWTATPDGILDYVNQVICDDFGFPDQGRDKHLKARLANTGQGGQALLADDEPWAVRPFRHADRHIDNAGPHVCDRNITEEGDNDSVWQQCVIPREVIANFLNVRRYLVALKTFQLACVIAANAVDLGKS